MKKILSILICLTLFAGIAACGGNDATSTDDNAATPTPTPVQTPTPSPLPVPPQIMSYNAGLQELVIFTSKTNDWILVHRGDYIIASLYDYVFRYKINENLIDRCIVINRFDFESASLSEDGRYLSIDGYLIDFENRVFQPQTIKADYETTIEIASEVQINETTTASMQPLYPAEPELMGLYKLVITDTEKGEDVEYIINEDEE